MNLANPDPDPANWRVVLPETDDLLTGHQIIDEKIYADYLQNVSSRIVRFDMDGTRIDEIPIPEHPVANLRSWQDGTALLTLNSLVTPSHILEIDLDTMETTEWLPSAVPFDSDAYEVSQHWYTSADGTRGRLYVAHRKGYEPDGDTPTVHDGAAGARMTCIPGG